MKIIISPWLKGLGVFVLFAMFCTASASAQQNYIVFNNQTGLPDDAVYINLSNTASGSGLFSGNGSSLALGDSISLAQLMGNVSNSNILLDGVPFLSIDQFSGQFSVSLGEGFSGNTQVPTTVVSGLMEATISGTSTQNNIDVSYINNIGLPISFSANYLSNSTVIPPSVLHGGNPVTTTSGNTIFNTLNSDPNIPSTAITNTSYSAVSSSNISVGTISGITNVAGPQGTSAALYRDWSTNLTVTNTTTNITTNYTAFIPSMTSSNASILIANYSVADNATVLPGADFGYSGSTPGPGVTSPFNSTVPGSGNFLVAQSYTFTATFTNDLNPGGTNANLTNQGIAANTAGVILTGNASAVGAMTIYIKNSDLNAAYGLYGANPYYTIEWPVTNVTTNTTTTYYTTQQNSNNLVDRIVGDLSSVINMGMANSSTVIDTHATGTNTSVNLNGTIFDPASGVIGDLPAGSLVGNLSSGEFFYLLSLQQSPIQLADWFGSSLQTNPLFYNNYGDAFISETDAYTYAYSDRLAGKYISADLYPAPIGTGLTSNDVYVEVTLGPGGYTFSPSTIPEPAAFQLLPFLAAGLALIGLRRWRRPQTA